MPANSIVVVSYNSQNCIEQCLSALVSARNWEIIVVDNASQDGTVGIVRSFEPRIKLLANSENRGFAGAVNQGIRAAQGDICLLLNPDVIASPEALDALAQALHPETVGAAGGKLTWSGLATAGFMIRRFPTLGSALCDALLLNKVWPSNPWNRHYRYLDVDYDRPQEVDQPAGACLALKREAWTDVGGLDEQFFPLWFEDVDLCRRLHGRGWKIVYCPQACFTHAGGHSVSQLSFADRQRFWYENQLRYFRKHHTRAQVFWLRSGIATGLLLRSILSVVGLRPKHFSIVDAISAYWGTAWRCCVRSDRANPKSTAAPVHPASS